MGSTTAVYPPNVSLYEALRVHPGASRRLVGIGLTRDYYDYRIDDAARAAGVPLAVLTGILAGGEDAPIKES
jgi:hypothetical protein